MRTTLDLPTGLIDEVVDLVEKKKKSEAVKIALEDFVRRKKIEKLLSLSGKIDIEDTTGELEKAEMDEEPYTR